MKRSALVIVALAGLCVAAAGGPPEPASVVCFGDEGGLVGTGSIRDGRWGLELDAGASGFVRIVIAGADGRVLRLQGVLPPGGPLHLVLPGGLTPASTFAARHALAYQAHARDETGAGVPEEGGAMLPLVGQIAD